MSEFLVVNWPIIVAVLLVAVAIMVAVWLVARRRSVVLDVPSLNDGPAAPTLTRTGPAAALPVVDPGVVEGDVLRLKGVGPRLASLLGTLNVTHVAQVAAWSDAELDRIDAQLGSFAGRARRDQWVEQARLLAAGDLTAYETRFGKIDPPSA